MSETKIQMRNCEKKEIESADCLAKVGVKDWLLYSEGALHKLQLFFLSIQSISFEDCWFLLLLQFTYILSKGVFVNFRTTYHTRAIITRSWL